MKGFTYIALLALLFVTACGGGGGAGSNPAPTPNPTPNPTPAPSVPNEVVVDTNSSDKIASFSLSLPEAIMQVAHIVLSEVAIQSIVVNSNYQEVLCEGSGNVSVAWNDIDESQNISVTDTLLLTLTNCKNNINEDFIDGTINLEVLTKNDNSINYNAQVNLSSLNEIDNISTEITGEFSLNYDQLEGVESFYITSNNQNLVFEVNGLIEQIQQLTLQKSVDSYFHYNVEYQVQVQSELLNGKLVCQTVEPIKGIINAFPYSMNVECNGANKGSVNLHMFKDENSPETDSYSFESDIIYNVFPSNGSNNQTFQVFSGDIVEGTLFQPIKNNNLPEPLSPSIEALGLPFELGINGLVVNSSKNEAYLYGEISGKSKGALYIVNLNTMEISQSITTDYSINKLTYSNKNNLIYSAGSTRTMPNTPSIYSFQQDDISIQSEISFENGISTPNENQKNSTHYPVKSMSTNNNGDLYFIVEDDFSYFESKHMLIKIANNQVEKSIDLNVNNGANHAIFTLNKEGMLYVDEPVSGFTQKQVTKYDGNLNLQEVKIFPHENLKNRGDSSLIQLVNNNLLYTGNGSIFDWDSGELIADFGYNNTHYLLNINIALEISETSEFQASNQTINIFSLSSYKIISSPIEYGQDIPTLNFSMSYLVDDDYLLVINRTLNENGTCPCQRTLFKIPLNLIY